MFEVYHYPLCPFSRKLRILLREKNIEFELFGEKFWERRPEFLAINPFGLTPVIKTPDNTIIYGNYAIFEYLEEEYPGNNMIGKIPSDKIRIRNNLEWFDNKFFSEVTRHLLFERIIKIVTKGAAPNSEAIRAASRNILSHMDYIEYLLKNNNIYLCGDHLSLADIAAAAQLSVVDYVGCVPWERYSKAKAWYALVKSRPSFRSILFDVLPGITPPKSYSNPDF